VALLVIVQLPIHDNSGGSVRYLTNDQPGCNSAEGVLVSPTVNFWEASGDQSVSSKLKATASEATSSAVRSAIERLAGDYQEIAAAKYSTGQNVGGTSQQVNDLNQEILYDTDTLSNVCDVHY
jgi:hypothetical protein